MIETLRRKALRRDVRVDARVGVAERLPYDLSSFSVVLSALLVHHLPADLQPDALAEMARVLQPDGRLVVADLAPPERGRAAAVLRRLARKHAANLGVERLRALAEGAGLVDVETGRSAHPWLAYVRARKPRLGQVT
jgi:demethylmenaquinone methyltransferase/2-methoxy-6-polyprenyl-1,4-benzoquinol methylase